MDKVLLLRSVAADASTTGDKYHEVFEKEDLEGFSISPISFEFCNLDELYKLIRKPSQFSGIIFSSPRTVQAVELSISQYIGLEEWASHLQADWKSLLAFSVGTSTSAAARQLGFETVGEDSGNAINLVKVILEKVKSGQAPLLFPCGSLKRDVIPRMLSEAGVNLTTCTTYKTCQEPKLNENLQVHILKQGVPSVVVFFSPSGVRFSTPTLRDLGLLDYDKVKYFAIGPTTATAMIELNYTIAGVSEKPNPESLVRVIKDR